MPYNKRHTPWVDDVHTIYAADMDGIEDATARPQPPAENAQPPPPSAQTTANGAAQKANNLSDVASPSTALANLSGVPQSRTVTAGTGLTGGGDLTANRSLAVDLEWIQDIVAGFLVAGSNITLTYNDAGGTLTVASTGGGSSAGLWTPPIVIAEGAYCSTDAYRSSTTTANAGNTGGNASGYPFSIDRQITIDSVSVVNATAGAAGTFSRFMIYAADSATGKPGTLVWDSGQEAQDVTGTKTFSTATTLDPGHYWAISVRAAGAGAAATYTAYNWGSIPWSSSVADTSNKSFDLGAISSTSAAPSTWPNSTYTPITRAPVAMWLHITAVT